MAKWRTYLVGTALIAAAFASGFGVRGCLQPDMEGVAVGKVRMWTCSMHPQIQLPGPGACPICGMDLIPVSDDSGEDSEAPVLKMSPAAVSLAEVETARVERKEVTAEVRMVGKVDYDETRIATITAWVPGRLERLFVDYTGVRVRKGDHLVELYSPEIRTAQEELIGSLRGGEALRDAAREKLRLWGLTPDQIRKIEERDVPTDHITIYAPIGGIVIHKNALEGMYVETGSRIYTIADLGQVWVKLDAYESDMMWIRYGQEVEFRTEAYPGQVFRGQIAFIDPVLDEKTRTVKVRVNVANPDRKLKPGMFVRAVVRASVAGVGLVMEPDLGGKWICPMHPDIVKDAQEPCDLCGMDLVKASDLGYEVARAHEPPLVIPVSAPLITGKRAVVYVRTDPGTFEGREVVLGPRAGGHYLVESGLAEGEEVVVQGNFKIDSALQIQARPSMMSAREAEPPPPVVEKHTVPAEVGEKVAAVLSAYLGYTDALYANDPDAAGEAVGAMRDAVKVADQGAGDVWKEISEAYHGAIDKVAGVDSLDELRAGLPALSGATEDLLKRFDWAGRPTLYRVHCPMAFGKGKGADWYQLDQEVRNPFFGEGAAMQRCGTVEGEE